MHNAQIRQAIQVDRFWIGSMRKVTRFLCGFAAALLLAPAAAGQAKSVNPGINDAFKDPDLKRFLGTFECESREIFAHRKDILKAIDLKPGMAVADIGAGTGLFTRLFAAEVGEKGKVYAVEIAEKFLDHIRTVNEREKITNVQTVLCKPYSSELPAASVDVVFICDTYHHFEYPQRTLASLHAALKSGGRLVLIDFHRIKGKSSDWVMNHVRAGQEIFEAEIAEAGFKKVSENKDFLKENYFSVFEKAGK